MVCSSPLPELLSHESLLWDHREISRRSVLPLHTQSSHRQRCLPCPHPLATRVGLPFRNSLQQAHLCTMFNLLDPTYPQVVCLLAGSAPAMIHAFATSQITGFSHWPTVLTSVAQSPLGQGRTEPHNSTQLQGPGALPFHILALPLSLFFALTSPCCTHNKALAMSFVSGSGKLRQNALRLRKNKKEHLLRRHTTDK